MRDAYFVHVLDLDGVLAQLNTYRYGGQCDKYVEFVRKWQEFPFF